MAMPWPFLRQIFGPALAAIIHYISMNVGAPIVNRTRTYDFRDRSSTVEVIGAQLTKV